MTPRPSRRNAARRLFNHALSLLNKGRVRPQLGRVAPQISTPKSNCAIRMSFLLIRMAVAKKSMPRNKDVTDNVF